MLKPSPAGNEATSEASKQEYFNVPVRLFWNEWSQLQNQALETPEIDSQPYPGECYSPGRQQESTNNP